jgi:hypothetical protein
MILLNNVFGDRMLCAWQPAPGITWIQTRSIHHARRLSQRGDGRVVMRSVAGGYLRTFEYQRQIGWAKRLMTRYIRLEVPAGALISSPPGPAGSRGREYGQATPRGWAAIS